MKDIVPRDSRYIPMTQQHWCCVPTCISMIMYRHNIPLIAAEELGHHLGLRVAEDQKYLFWNVETGPKPPGGYGTRIFEKEFYPDKAFSKLGIPLKMIYHPIDDFNNFQSVEDYLAVIEKNGSDVIACFDYGTLHNHPNVGGHATLVDRYYASSQTVRLIDPWFELPKWQEVKAEKLYEAMQAHGSDKMGGFWEFIKI